MRLITWMCFGTACIPVLLMWFRSLERFGLPSGGVCFLQWVNLFDFSVSICSM